MVFITFVLSVPSQIASGGILRPRWPLEEYLRSGGQTVAATADNKMCFG